MACAEIMYETCVALLEGEGRGGGEKRRKREKDREGRPAGPSTSIVNTFNSLAKRRKRGMCAPRIGS